jgi:molybdopterin molybdotransferase
MWLEVKQLMYSAPDAEAKILSLVQPLSPELDIEQVDLLAAGDRILAQPVSSSLDFPYWDNSAMDGYAVRFADVESASSEQPVSLLVVEEIPAGRPPQNVLQPQQAARIFTGSMLPEGADTIVIQEEAQRSGEHVQIAIAPSFQAYVRHRGSFYRAGQPLLQPGTLLKAPELAVLATAQCIEIPVFRRPVVAILSTGNELIAPDQPLKPGQIIDSNQYALAQLVAETGAIPKRVGTVGDRPQDLRAAIERAIATSDLVISSGGVSVGDYDFVDQILTELGATLHIRSVAVRPGKPLTVATFPADADRNRPLLYFGLPGNPVSALVSFWRFVQPALKKLSGLRESYYPEFVTARTKQPLQGDTRRETYLWGKLRLIGGEYEFELASGSHSSGNLMNLALTNGLAVLSSDLPTIAAGDNVPVLKVGAPKIR